MTGLPDERAVEIDDMQILEALRLERARLRRRIAVEHGRVRHVALVEPHAGAVLEVDGRNRIMTPAHLRGHLPLQEVRDQPQAQASGSSPGGTGVPAMLSLARQRR